MKVGFYGHVRQYHNIKGEIDANIQKVLESGEYVQGPMNKQFEKELAEFCGTKFAIANGIPNMLIEEAELPEGCATIAELKCVASGEVKYES